MISVHTQSHSKLIDDWSLQKIWTTLDHSLFGAGTKQRRQKKEDNEWVHITLHAQANGGCDSSHNSTYRTTWKALE